jgi:hypothetical protein
VPAEGVTGLLVFETNDTLTPDDDLMEVHTYYHPTLPTAANRLNGVSFIASLQASVARYLSNHGPARRHQWRGTRFYCATRQRRHQAHEPLNSEKRGQAMTRLPPKRPASAS